MTAQKKKLIGIFITIVGGILWGFSGACAQYLFQYKDISSQWLVPIRLVVAGFVMLAYFIVKDRKRTFAVWKGKRNAIDVVVYGVFGLMACQYTYFATIERSNAGTATVLQYVAPVMIMLVICIMEKKLPKIVDIVAIVCALTGVFLIATHGNIHQLVISKETLVLGLISAVTIVVYNIQPRNLMSQFSTPLLLAWGMSVGGILLFLVFQPWKYTPNMDIQTIAAMFAIIFFGTIIAFTLYMLGVKWIGATHASLYACIEPVVAMVLASVWLGAPFTFIDMIGFLFIISTIFILTLAGKEKVSTGEQRA